MKCAHELQMFLKTHERNNSKNSYFDFKLCLYVAQCWCSSPHGGYRVHRSRVRYGVTGLEVEYDLLVLM